MHFISSPPPIPFFLSPFSKLLHFSNYSSLHFYPLFPPLLIFCILIHNLPFNLGSTTSFFSPFFFLFPFAPFSSPFLSLLFVCFFFFGTFLFLSPSFPLSYSFAFPCRLSSLLAYYAVSFFHSPILALSPIPFFLPLLTFSLIPSLLPRFYPDNSLCSFPLLVFSPIPSFAFLLPFHTLSHSIHPFFSFPPPSPLCHCFLPLFLKTNIQTKIIYKCLAFYTGVYNTIVNSRILTAHKMLLPEFWHSTTVLSTV